jgi:hypothetical protein
MASMQQLSDAKKVAKRDFGGMPGVEGIGIGDGVLRVYVQDADVIGRLPRSCEAINIEFVISGEVKSSDP